MVAADSAHSIDHERDEDEIDLLEYWKILRDRKWLIAAITGGVMALALVLTLLTTPIFQSPGSPRSTAP